MKNMGLNIRKRGTSGRRNLMIKSSQETRAEGAQEQRIRQGLLEQIFLATEKSKRRSNR